MMGLLLGHAKADQMLRCPQSFAHEGMHVVGSIQNAAQLFHSYDQQKQAAAKLYQEASKRPADRKASLAAVELKVA